MVRCEQVQYNGDRSQTVGHWIGPADQPLIEERPGDAKAQRIKEWHGERAVFGVLAEEINLSQDEITTKKILDRATRFAQEKCPCGPPSPFEAGWHSRLNISVEVRHGDPATFTEDKYTGVRIGQGNSLLTVPDGIYELFKKDYPVVAIEGKTSTVGGGDESHLDKDGHFDHDIPWSTSAGWAKSSYRNRDRERLAMIEKKRADEERLARQRDEEAGAANVRRAEAARIQQAQRTAQLAAQAATQKEQTELSARSAAFVAANGVKHFVTISQLAANPFIYQGQVVAVYAVFAQMNSATEGLFSGSEFSDALLVSAIPTARFTQPRSMVMLAGRVVGKQEVKLPLLGPTLVPHISFVGSAFCQKQNCLDYVINLK
jgi:hypothetical protein